MAKKKRLTNNKKSLYVNKNMYVVSTLSKSKKNKYKIGYHGGTQQKLLSRYQTYLINPIVFYFRPVINYSVIDTEIKTALKKHRIKNNNGNYSEWFQLKLEDIILRISKIIDEHDSDNNKYYNDDDDTSDDNDNNDDNDGDGNDNNDENDDNDDDNNNDENDDDGNDNNDENDDNDDDNNNDENDDDDDDYNHAKPINKKYKKCTKIIISEQVYYQCDNCKRNFALKGDYTRHMNRKTPCSILKNKKLGDKPKIFTCECGKTFKRKDHYEKHLKTHQK